MIGFKSHGFQWLGLLVLFTNGLGGSTWAQFPLFPQGESSDEAFLLAPRPLMRLLREGESAFKEQRYADGIAALSSLLLADDQDLPADVRGQDYFVEAGIGGLFSKSVKGEAIRLLSELPPEGRRTLEVQFGVTARRELTSAIAKKDFDQIGSVARKYMHTDAGYDAQVLLAQFKLTSGHPLAAAGLLQNLLAYPAARERYGAGLALATARAWRLAGNPEAAGLTLRMAARSFPGESLEIAGRQVSLDVNTDWVSVLAREAENEKPVVNSAANRSWMVAGGTPERNGISQAGMPLPTERWVREIHSSLPEQEAILRQSAVETQKGRVLLPKFELRMVGDLVLTKTTDASLLAIDFETGVIKWPLYFHNAPVQLTNLPYAEAGGNASLSDELQTRVWGSSAFGKFSCDEQRLYLVSEQSDHILSAENVFKVDDGSQESNFLEGASLQAQGAILWRVGGSNGADEPQLAGAYFLGPPLPFEGELYGLVDIKGETKLVVLDANTGRLRWKQQLVQSSTPGLRFDAERRSQALSPTIAEGVILCPTGVGAVVAVDLLSHSLRWGATYTTHRSNQSNAFRQRGAFGDGPDFLPLERRWQEPAMIAQDGVVLISPPESDDMFCRDILTGVSKLAPQRRNSYRYIAGARNGLLIAVGERQVFALEMSTGKPAWQCEFPKGLTLAGKGLWQIDSLLLPLSDRLVIRVSTDDGRIIDQAQVAQPLGNLFAYQDQLLSVSASAVTVYYTRESLAKQVAERLAANPNDTWALNQQSQLALVGGNLTQALKSLEKSYALDPDSADTRYLLVDLLLDGLMADFPRFEELAQKYADVVEIGPQRFRFLQQLALGKIRSGQHLAAFKRLLMLIPQVGSTFAATQNRQRELELDEGYSVDSDVWIATELSRAYARADEQDRQAMQSLIADELASIENTLVPLRREKLRFLQWLPPASAALVDLAGSMLGGEEQTIAEQLLLPVLYSDDPQHAAIAQGMLQQPALVDQRFSERASLAGELLIERDAVNAPLSDNRESNNLDRWNRGVVRMDASDESRYQFGAKIETVAERFGRPEVSVALSASMVVLRTGNGDDRAHFEFPGASSDAPTDALTRAIIRGGLMLIEKSSEIAAFDIHRDMASGVDAMLWRHSLFSPGAGPSVPFAIPEVATVNTRLGFALSHRQMPGKQQALVGPLTPAGIVVQIGTKIVLLDSMSGRQIWSRDGYDDQVRIGSQGMQVAVVNPSLGATQILDCRDGALVRQAEYRGDWVPWFSHNGMMVEFSESRVVPPPPTTLRIWNAFSGEEALRLQLAPGSCADVCEGRYLVILEPDSKLHFCDLQNPQQLLIRAHQVSTDSKVESISVQRFEERLVVLTNSGKARPALEDMLPVNGDVYCLDGQTGELLWNRPGRLTEMQFPKSQPRQSPFMVVFRMDPPRDNIHRAAVALIDLRSGRLAYSNQSLPLRASMGFAMSLRPARQTIEVGLGARSLRFTIGDGPRPPQPVFVFGGASPSGKATIQRDAEESFFRRR